MLSRITTWFLAFFDINGDKHITFPDVCMVVVGAVFTAFMCGLMPTSAPQDVKLWVAYALVIGGYAGGAKVLEYLRRDSP